MIRSFVATWTNVYAGSPSERYDHTNTMAVHGAAPSRTAPARYSLARSTGIHLVKTILRKNHAIAYIVNGLMSQLDVHVTMRPRFFSPTRRMDAKSICSIIG